MISDKDIAASWRCLISCAAFAGTSLIVSAQSVAPDTAAPDQVVKMDLFEVTSTQGHGYVTTNAAEGFKTNESLMDIPQIDVVVSNDLLHDIGFENLNVTLQYFGVYSSYESDQVKLRGGGSTTQLYTDEFPAHGGSWADNAVVDSVELIKGGSEGLYMLNSGLGGIVMKDMKKPLPYEQNTFWGTIDEWGLWQVGLDSTGPMGKLGDVSLTYRVVADYQRGTTYFSNVKDNRETIYPYFQAKYNNTTIRFHFDGEHYEGIQGAAELLTPTGGLYTGAGRRESNEPPNNGVEVWNDIWESTILQRFSDNWEMRLSGQYYNQGFFGPQIITDGSIWGPVPTILYTNRQDDQRWRYWTAISDISGKYNIGPTNWEMRNTDIIGWAFTDQVVEKYIFSTTVYPFSDVARGIPLLPGQPSSTFAVPANSSAAINAVVNPPLDTYYQPAPSVGAGSHTTTWNGGAYWQHTIAVVPKWFDVTVGESWVSIITDTVANVSLLPWQATELHYDEWVHRIAGVVHLGPNVSLYALNATNFSPPATIGYLESGAFTPPQNGKDNEIGLKSAFLGGRISTDFSWFNMVTDNVAEPGGFFSNGTEYSVLSGSAVEEGIDGDLAISVLPGWQLIGSFYAGHDRDQNNFPVSGTWDNSWGVFTRYDFQKDSPLHGLTLGTGLSRIGGRWEAYTGIVNQATYGLPSSILTGEIKVQTGSMMNGFVQYAFNKHLTVGIYLTNLLNQVYPLDTQQSTQLDASPPEEWRLQAEYKY